MRCAATAAVLVAGCSAHLGEGPSGGADAQQGVDARVYRDARIDAPPDARPCTGGDAAMVGPDGLCFVMINTPTPYLQAKAGCDAMTAHLAYLKTAALDTFAETFIGTIDIWIGGSDQVTEGAWLWEDGTAFGFTNWHAGEPNNGGTGGVPENCAIINGARAGKGWDDRGCGSSYAVLCTY